MTTVGAWSGGVQVVTCPKCQHEWQHRRPGNRARTCPKCGHAGPREDFAHRELEGAPSSSGAAPAPAGSTRGAEGSPPTTSRGSTSAPARKLRGAAKRAHEAKAAGRQVKIGAVAIGGANGGDPQRSRAPTPARSSRSFRDLLARVIG